MVFLWISHEKTDDLGLPPFHPKQQLVLMMNHREKTSPLKHRFEVQPFFSTKEMLLTEEK